MQSMKLIISEKATTFSPFVEDNCHKTTMEQQLLPQHECLTAAKWQKMALEQHLFNTGIISETTAPFCSSQFNIMFCTKDVRSSETQGNSRSKNKANSH